MKIIPSVNCIMILAIICSEAFACQPCPDVSVEQRVSAEWNDSESIIIATVVKVEKFLLMCRRKSYDGKTIRADIPTERVQFRVDRVFKGSMKPGDRFVTETNLRPDRCIGPKSVEDSVWFDLSKHGDSPSAVTMQWLIYNFPSRVHELAGCSTLPLDIAANQGDIDLLELLQGASSGNQQR